MRADLVEKHEAVTAWREQHCAPVEQAVRARNRWKAEQALASAAAALRADTEFAADERRACELRLAYLSWRIARELGEQQEALAAFWTVREQLEHARFECDANHEHWTLSLAKCNALLLQLRVSAERANFAPLSHSEFEELYANIPAELLSCEVWDYIARWAFFHRDEEFLGEALAAVTEAGGWRSDVNRQRISTMYQLVRGTASRDDILELFNRIEQLPQMDEFNRHMWPLVIERGIADSGLEQIRATLSMRISNSAPMVPRRAPAAKAVAGLR